ncbi:hypothetical protein RXV94_09195 [Yeosuana sp. MJ-SS3]|uniref:Uncharacterized protein n=1 Tax=Gilvirhabdus luticola TaxID=3079858 RepID=A0ABU3U7P1_9FLAO|nr:hypothetical protein [Yeosuana sp. MJ-SS3]MDU8886334.1 hypothetical protein [Yeosuana sp. MJ-SS3]
MVTKCKDYGKWIGSANWTYNATIRRHYKLTEFNTKKMMDNLIKQKGMNKLFFSIEDDKNDNMTHVHLLIDSDSNYSRERLARELGVNMKAVSFLEEVKSIRDIAYYITKGFWKRTSFYDIRFKK